MKMITLHRKKVNFIVENIKSNTLIQLLLKK